MTQLLQYVDAARPDDTGDGLTMATAKRTPRAAQQNISTGGKILIKNGLCYDSVSGLFLFFTGVSNVEVGTYGPASDKPILDALTYESPGASGWTYISGGIWKKVFAAYSVRRLWVGSTNVGNLVSQRVLGTAKRRATSPALILPTSNPTEADVLAALNANNIWFSGGNIGGTPSSLTSFALYIYTGTGATSPPDYYGGLAFIQSDNLTVGAVDGVHVQNQSGIWVHDIHFRGNGSTGIRTQAQNSDARDASDCLFENCTVTAPYQSAYRSGINVEVNPVRRIRRMTVRNIYCDYISNADEMEPDTTYSYLSGVVDLYNLYDGTVDTIVQGCTGINGAHNGVSVGNILCATPGTAPTGCKILGNYIKYDSWHTYARGCSTFNCPDLEVAGNTFDGQNTRSQLQGIVDFHDNLYVDMGSSVRKAGVDQLMAFESYVFDTFASGIGNDRYLVVNPVNVRIRNNVAFAPKGTVWSFNHFSSGKPVATNSYPAGCVTLTGNTIIGPAGLTTDTYQDTGRTVGTQTIQGNRVYNGAVGDKKVTWIGKQYSLSDGPGCIANQEVHPLLDSPPFEQSVNGLNRAGIAIVNRAF